MNLSPIQLLREAIKAVPALKYALGVAGLVAVVAIVGAFRVRPEIAVLGAIATLVLMAALLVFAKLTKTGKKHFLFPALVMMWSFLVLVIAAASLLFCSTFFNWPMDFRSAPVKHNDSGPNKAQVEAKLQTARQQLEVKEYEGAWKTLQGAASLQANSDAVLDTQVDVAMAWLRNLVVRQPHTYTEIVDQLTPCLYSALSKAKDGRAADIQAHIGWAYFLKSRENPVSVPIDAEFHKALKVDPQNTYAHAMLGHRLLQEWGKVEEARRHFEAALATRRDSEWVTDLRFAGLRWMNTADHKLELARVANEMRMKGEALSDEYRDYLFTQIYWSGAEFDYLTNLIHSLPATQHLETLEWLAAPKGWDRSWPVQKFVRAELKELNGDCAGALEIYQKLPDLPDDFQNEITNSIARCKARMKSK